MLPFQVSEIIYDALDDGADVAITLNSNGYTIITNYHVNRCIGVVDFNEVTGVTNKTFINAKQHKIIGRMLEDQGVTL